LGKQLKYKNTIILELYFNIRATPEVSSYYNTAHYVSAIYGKKDSMEKADDRDIDFLRIIININRVGSNFNRSLSVFSIRKV